MSTVHGGPGNIVTNGLVLNLDAANPRSYPPPYNGTVWRDLSGNGNNGTLVNNLAYTTASRGGLDQRNDNTYVTIPSTNLKFEGNVSFTVDITIKKNTFAGFYPALMGCGDYDGTFAGGWVVWFYNTATPNGTIGLARMLGGVAGSPVTEVFYGFSSTTETDSITNFTLIYDSILGSSIYKNSSLVRSSSSTAVSSQRSAGAPPVYIGRRASSGALTNVIMFNTKIYNRALSASEVLQNFNATRARFGI